MKISAWHKQNGDSVEWYQPMFSGHMDIVYMSKVFSFTPDYEYFIDADKIIRGVPDMLYLLMMARKYMTKQKTFHYLMRLNIFILTIVFIQNVKILHTAF